jgi:hypothetical protein
VTSRIFHGPNNIGGAAGLLARKQRELGADARSVCFPTGSYAFEVDQEVTPGLSARIELLRQWRRFDVFHFYYGESLIGSRLSDVALLRRAGKRVFFYFCGCDVRDAKAIIGRDPISACAECWPAGCAANRDLAVEVAMASDGCFVSTPDLLEFVPGAMLLPQPIDLDALAVSGPSAPRRDGIVRVAHAPSNRAIKGTGYVERAVAELQASGEPIELVLVEGRSHAESMEIFRSCDIAVDQVLIGAYGGFAVEMMALGKPVVAYIRPDLRSAYADGMPVVSAAPAELVEVLRTLARDADLRARVGAAGPGYVAEVHDASRVARQALDAYGVPYRDAAGADA